MDKFNKTDKFSKWDYRYMEMAELVGTWSNCLRDERHVGSVAVLDKRVICTAYNGAPIGVMSCKERGECIRLRLGISSAKSPEICYSVHSEQALICNAAKQGLSLEGSTVYCTHQPCVICLKMLINAGVVRIVYKVEYPDEFSKEIAREIGFKLEQIGENPYKNSEKQGKKQRKQPEKTQKNDEFEQNSDDIDEESAQDKNGKSGKINQTEDGENKNTNPDKEENQDGNEDEQSRNLNLEDDENDETLGENE